MDLSPPRRGPWFSLFLPPARSRATQVSCELLTEAQSSPIPFSSQNKSWRPRRRAQGSTPVQPGCWEMVSSRTGQDVCGSWLGSTCSVRVRERERERECVCVCVNVHACVCGGMEEDELNRRGWKILPPENSAHFHFGWSCFPLVIPSVVSRGGGKSTPGGFLP